MAGVRPLRVDSCRLVFGRLAGVLFLELRRAEIAQGGMEALFRSTFRRKALRSAATKDIVSSRRMLALALVLEAASRNDSARAAGMDPADPAKLGATLQRGEQDGLRNQPNIGPATATLEHDRSSWIDLVL